MEVDKKFRDKLEVGYKFQFFSPEKKSANKLSLSKNSYAKKLGFDDSVKTEKNEENVIKLKELVGRMDKTIVNENIAVKVKAIYKEQVVKNNNVIR